MKYREAARSEPYRDNIYLFLKKIKCCYGRKTYYDMKLLRGAHVCLSMVKELGDVAGGTEKHGEQKLSTNRIKTMKHDNVNVKLSAHLFKINSVSPNSGLFEEISTTGNIIIVHTLTTGPQHKALNDQLV